MRRRVLACLVVFGIPGLVSCGGGGASTPPPPTSTITSVSVNTTAHLLRSSQPIQFTSIVQGTGGFIDTVNWSVNGISGGNAANGTVSSSGIYTAPSSIPATNPVTITATSVEDPTKSGSATLTVFTLTISPASVTVYYTHAQQFTATVAGITNPTLSWKAQLGTIDDNGLYTAPAIMAQNSVDTVSVNVANSGSAAVTAAITLLIPAANLTSLSPNDASANETITINGQNLVGVQQVFFPGPFGTTLPASFQSVSPSEVTAMVPPGTVTGSLYVTLQPSPGFNETSNSLTFTRFPNVRIRVGEKGLSSGETTQFSYALLGASSPSTVNWTADKGKVSDTGLYHAPSVSEETFVTVTGCLQSTNSCDATMLRISPLRIAPALPVVSLGQNVQLTAIEGSPISATWSVLAGGGTVSPSGLFTAPTNPAQAGGVPVSATAGSASDATSISVTGAFPGIVSRTTDYIHFGYDQKKQRYLQNLEGTHVQALAVSGSRAYALDDGVRFNESSVPYFSALDVYDISDPTHPAWLSAADSMIALPLLFGINGNYLFEGTESVFAPPSRVAVYDLRTTPPALVSFAFAPDLYTLFENNGVIYGVPMNRQMTGATAPVYVLDFTSGTIQQREIDVTPPADADPGNAPSNAIGKENLLYVGFYTANGFSVATYDTSSSPPALLSSTPLNETILWPLTMSIRGNFLFVLNEMLDISGSTPVLVGTVPVQNVEDLQGTMLLGCGSLPIYIATPNVFKIVDLSTPANPVTTISMYADTCGGSFSGNGSYVLAPDGLGGIATIDFSQPGGMIDKSRTGAFPNGVIFDHAINQQTIFAAGEDELGSGGLATFDLSSGTPYLGGLFYSLNAGLAVKVAGNVAFLGLVDSLKTVDVTDVANPVETGSVPLPTSALALSGKLLFDATMDARLVALNVTTPTNPVTLGSVNLPAAATNLRLVGNTLFVADGPAGLLVFDVSNPAAPALLSQLTLSTPVWDVGVASTLAFLAADGSGLVIVDISNLSQPNQLSQTVLESTSPFPPQFSSGPRSVALSIALQNGLVYVGTENSEDLVFTYDYSQPAYPRLVSLNAFGEFTDSLISGLGFVGNDIYVFGTIGVEDGIVQADNSQPLNNINLYYPPLALRGPQFDVNPDGKKANTHVHPKFDRGLFQRTRQYKNPPIAADPRFHGR